MFSDGGWLCDATRGIKEWMGGSGAGGRTVTCPRHAGSLPEARDYAFDPVGS